MQTLTIKINNNKNAEFLIQLLRKFNFVTEIKTSENVKVAFDDSSIKWATGIPAVSDFAGIWKKTPKTLEQIREKAWKRN